MVAMRMPVQLKGVPEKASPKDTAMPVKRSRVEPSNEPQDTEKYMSSRNGKDEDRRPQRSPRRSSSDKYDIKMNPFAQAWQSGSPEASAGNAPSGISNPWDSDQATPPSIFGALPYPSSSAFPGSPVDLTVLYFTSFNPTILNCSVIGAHSQPRYFISTDAAMPGYTVWRDANDRNFALVEWQSHPAVEIRDILPKQSVHTWLVLAQDRSHRTMKIRGYQYIWAPSGPNICLYTMSDKQRLLGRIVKDHAHVMLELSSQAMQLGLLEACIVAVVLLQSGRNID